MRAIQACLERGYDATLSIVELKRSREKREQYATLQSQGRDLEWQRPSYETRSIVQRLRLVPRKGGEDAHPFLKGRASGFVDAH
jgi:hypothetical protein